MNQPGGFVPIPILNLPQMGGDSPPKEDNMPPARVMVALRYLDYLYRKTDTKIAVNDIQIDPIPGIQPTKEEVLTSTAANVMLADYFKGKLPPDEQEKYRRKANRGGGPQGGGTLMGCPICVGSTGMVHSKCQLCGGEGKIIAYRTER